MALGRFKRSRVSLHRAYATGYKLTELKHKLKRIGIKHITVSLDNCNAGGIFVDRGLLLEKSELVLDRLGNAPVVDVITAVTAEEQAIEDMTTGHGVFTKVRCDLLSTGEIFKMYGDRDCITNTELFCAVRQAVMERAEARGKKMTPMHEKILSEHPEGAQCYGDMLFFRRDDTGSLVGEYKT